MSAAMISLSACTHRYSDLPASQTSQRYQDFLQGKATLDCELNCSGAWGWARPTLLQYIAQQRWVEVAQKVLEIGYHDDLAWYYLGRSAEELNAPRAALIYYYKAEAAKQCDGLFNNCDGFKFPEAAQARIDTLTQRGFP
jgi:hypothetical protein